MMRAIAESCPGHLIKSQQRDDPDLTAEEKEVELTRIFEANPASFLRRFRGHLRREHLAEIRQRRQKRAPEVREAENGENTETVETVLSGCGDYEVEFLIKEIFEEMDDRKRKTKIKNRRYAALKNFREEDFFRLESITLPFNISINRSVNFFYAFPSFLLSIFSPFLLFLDSPFLSPFLLSSFPSYLLSYFLLTPLSPFLRF